MGKLSGKGPNREIPLGKQKQAPGQRNPLAKHFQAPGSAFLSGFCFPDSPQVLCMKIKIFLSANYRHFELVLEEDSAF